MNKALLLIFIISPSLVISDSQGGEWYEHYGKDVRNYEDPADPPVAHGHNPASGHWQDIYPGVKNVEKDKKEEGGGGGLFAKVKSELSGVRNKFFGGLSKLTGRTSQPVAEERVSNPDPLLDFDFDFNIGHPKLGYVGNGFHVRSADTAKARQHTDLQVEPSNQQYNPQYGSVENYNYDYQTPFNPSNQRPQRDSPPPGQESFYEYQEPSQQGFIPVGQSGGSYTDGQTAYDASYYSPESGYAVDPSAYPPYDEAAEYYGEPVTKPPLHIKIQQDLGNLVNGIVKPIKNLIPKKKPAAAVTEEGPGSSYQLVPASSAPYQPVDNQLEAASSYDPELIHRNEQTGSSGMFATPFGKPPLMEKIRQDFFSWLPKAKREIKHNQGFAPPANAPIQSQSFPVQEPFPVHEPFPVAEPLPAHNHQTRQVQHAAPAFFTSGSGDNQVLFKIIPVETDGPPLYQIVPSGPSATTFSDSRPVFSHTSTASSHNHNVHSAPPQQQFQSDIFTAAQTQQSTAHSAPPQQQQTFVQSQFAQPSLTLPPVAQNQAAQTFAQPQSQPIQFVPDPSKAQLRSSDVDPRFAPSDLAQVIDALPSEEDIVAASEQQSRSGRLIDLSEDNVEAESSANDGFVFLMSAPDMTKEKPESKKIDKEELVILDNPEALGDGEIHTFQLEMVREKELPVFDAVEEVTEPLIQKPKEFGDDYEVEETLP